MSAGRGDDHDILMGVLVDAVPALFKELLAIVDAYDTDSEYGDLDDGDLIMDDSGQPDGDDGTSVDGQAMVLEVDAAVELAGAVVGLCRDNRGGVLESLVFKDAYEVTGGLFKHDALGRLSNRNSLVMLRIAAGDVDSRHPLHVLHRAGADEGSGVWALVGSFLRLPVVATLDLTN
jgi:hypothetical protein